MYQPDPSMTAKLNSESLRPWITPDVMASYKKCLLSKCEPAVPEPPSSSKKAPGRVEHPKYVLSLEVRGSTLRTVLLVPSKSTVLRWPVRVFPEASIKFAILLPVKPKAWSISCMVRYIFFSWIRASPFALTGF